MPVSGTAVPAPRTAPGTRCRVREGTPRAWCRDRPAHADPGPPRPSTKPPLSSRLRGHDFYSEEPPPGGCDPYLGRLEYPGHPPACPPPSFSPHSLKGLSPCPALRTRADRRGLRGAPRLGRVMSTVCTPFPGCTPAHRFPRDGRGKKGRSLPSRGEGACGPPAGRKQGVTPGPLTQPTPLALAAPHTGEGRHGCVPVSPTRCPAHNKHIC